MRLVVDRYPRMRAGYARPSLDRDTLYASESAHGIEPKCDWCDNYKELYQRPHLNPIRSLNDQPRIHYGLITSGNKVIASASEKDRLLKDRDILCFEMKAAGLIDSFPCLVGNM